MKVLVASAIVLLATSSSVAHAQEKGTWEFGADTGIVFSFISDIQGEPLWEGGPVVGGVDGRTDFHTVFPGTSWRIAYFVGSSLSLELPFAFRYSNYGEGYGLEWSYSLSTGLGLLYNLKSGIFAGVNGTVAVSDAGYSDDSPFRNPDAWDVYALGATLGLRHRVFADNVRFRLSLDYAYQFEKDDPSLRPFVQPQTNNLGLSFGFSLLI
jgi:hypothetical protein